MTATISNIDIAIIIGYFMLVLAIGFWIARQTETGEDFLYDSLLLIRCKSVSLDQFIKL